MNISSYAETVARSTSREAQNRGLLDTVTTSNRDLVKMSSHATTCPVCAPLQGRVYSISGTSTEYPPLEFAYGGAYANVHPSCRHVLMPYVPELDEDREKIKQFSNRGFDIDPRSKSQIDNYNREQKKNAERNRDRRQWERYKMAMPDETPKTFSAFRKSKASGSKAWQDLESKYRSLRIKGDVSTVKAKPKPKPKKDVYNKFLTGYSDKDIKNVKSAMNEVLKTGLENNAENMYTYDILKSEKSYRTILGEKTRVVLPDNYFEHLKTSKEASQIIIHNHPRNGAFSAADINVMIQNKSIKEMLVIAHDKTLYRAYKTKDTIVADMHPRWKKKIDSLQGKYQKKFEKSLKEFEAKGLDDFDAYNKATDLISKEHTHEAMELLAKANKFEYRRVLPNEQ